MTSTLRLTTALAGLTLAGSAFAADLPRRAPPPVFTPVPVFTWTGAYFGVNAGYVLTDQRSALTTAPGSTTLQGVLNAGGRAALVSTQTDGFSGGGQIGYNYQFTPGSGVVIGVEADAAYTDIDRRRVFATSQGNNVVQNRLDFLGTVRGRLGYAFDRVLVYGTGGFAYGNVRSSANFFNNGIGGALGYTGLRDDIQTGYTVGGGVEYALPTDSFLNFFKSSAVTVKAEALYYDLGRRNTAINVVSPALVGPGYVTRFENSGIIARAGINYKFGTF